MIIGTLDNFAKIEALTSKIAELLTEMYQLRKNTTEVEIKLKISQNMHQELSKELTERNNEVASLRSRVAKTKRENNMGDTQCTTN